ncbi:MAG: cation:proton antiporter [Vulcanimicrobiaceae bacterium]
MSDVLLVVVLLGVAFLFARVTASAGLPAPVAVTLVGIAAGGILPFSRQIELGPLLFGLFLPALIFESTWDMDAAALWRVRGTVAALAFPGVLLTAASIALCARGAGGVGWAAALTLGAILAATDPIAVLGLFRRLSLPGDLLTIVEGESIGNDAVALVLVQTLVPLAAVGVDWSAAGLAALKFVYVACAGVAVGIAFAYVASRAAALLGNALGAIPLTIVVAYGSYAAATTVSASGLFAVASAGIALRSLTRGSVGAASSERIDRFWDRSALLANAVVFLLVGLTLRLERIFNEPALIALTLLGVVAARFLLAYLIARPPVRGPEAAGWKHAIALAGLRGGLSLAMALQLPAGFPSRPALIDAVFAIVFLTLVVAGWLLAPILRRAAPGLAVERSLSS